MIFSITLSFCMSMTTSMLFRQLGIRRRSKTVMPVVNSPDGLHVAGHLLGHEQLRIGHGHQRDGVVDVDAFQAELLPVGAEGRGKDLPQEAADLVDSSGSWWKRS